ncbi:MAG: Muramoyltetrapeptide carboxypeptidase [Polaromonas sp.]|nr:Muramoyltetrapeptide carboxypeptidase [Polaromonas sp.]MDB5844132.1 Muramoyltetrapeptide carboxypeptidase [Polaromonas sp.]MDB5940410.1 Muramoyltetrapeptide carboxypeptidase [Polaromonas sp.]
MKKHIYIYSPSSAVRDKSAFKRGLKRLATLGYEVEVDEAALACQQRFAGDEAQRLAAIHRAASSGADVALITRGGYGLTRLLPHIDYQAVAAAIERGTQFVGFSDFTAFQMALMAKTGAVTWAGPALGEDFGAPAGPDDIMEACFGDLITGQGEGSGWRLSKSAMKSIAVNAGPESANAHNDTYSINNAVLWGGNLSLLASLVGTPYMPVVNDGILFIEDVAEHPYRVERMLAQLLQAGILERQKAIIFGQFNHYQLVPHDKGYNMASVIEWLQSQVTARVLTGLPIGHVATKVVLPVGLPVTLAVEGRDAFLLWGHRH